MSVAAIAATAVSAGESFLPYMTATCGMLGPLMTLQEENMLNVRGRVFFFPTCFVWMYESPDVYS